MKLEDYVTLVYDFPKPGVVYRDITPLLANGEAFRYVCNVFADYAKNKGATKIVGPESRGFIFGCPVSAILEIGFIPIRKPGKLPREAITKHYELEYGYNELAIHADAIKPGDKIVIIDDLLATGGTINATIDLVKSLGGEVVGIGCFIELVDLGGREKLEGNDILVLLKH